MVIPMHEQLVIAKRKEGGGSRRRSRVSFRINALTDAVNEAKEQFIKPTTLPSIESNEVEFFKKNASTSLMQQPINMCNLAAVNVGLRSINVETNLDEIFEICEKQMISINDVTTAGLTLGDIGPVEVPPPV